MKILKNPRIAHAILWAAAMIGTALLLRGSEHEKEVFLLLVVLASVSITLPNRREKKDCTPSSEA